MDWNTTKPRQVDLRVDSETKKTEETLFFQFSYGYVSVEKLIEISNFVKNDLEGVVREVKEKLTYENLPFRLNINVYDDKKIGTLFVEIENLD